MEYLKKPNEENATKLDEAYKNFDMTVGYQVVGKYIQSVEMITQ